MSRRIVGRSAVFLDSFSGSVRDGNTKLRDLIARQAYGNGEAADAIRAL